MHALLAARGPVQLSEVPNAWNSLYGADKWATERPVRTVHKACVPPHVKGIDVIDGWVHVIEDLAQLDEELSHAAKVDVANARMLSSDVGRLIADEFRALCKLWHFSTSYARASTFWKCCIAYNSSTEAAEEPEAAEASKFLPKTVGYGATHNDALVMARKRILEHNGSWCDESDARFQKLMCLRAALDQLPHDFVACGEAETPPTWTLREQLEHMIVDACALVRDPPPCRGACCEVISRVWPQAIALQDVERLCELVRSLKGTPVPLPLEVWSNLAEIAAWSLNLPALEQLEDLAVAETSHAAHYVRHHLYSLLLEQRAQLRQEAERPSFAGTPVRVRWELGESGWSCAFDAAAVPGLCIGGRGAALRLVERGGALCEVVDDSRAVLRSADDIGVLVGLLATKWPRAQALPCHAQVHARQREVLRALFRDSPSIFDRTLRSILVDTWGAEPDHPTGSKILNQRAEFASQHPDVFLQKEGDGDNDNIDSFEDFTPCREHWEFFTEAQRSAIWNSLKRCFSLVRGPPGTGKTHVAAAIAMGCAERLPKGNRVLAVAQSNAAARNLHRRLETFGVPAARIGMALRPSEVVEQQLFHTLQGQSLVESEARLLERAAREERGSPPRLSAEHSSLPASDVPATAPETLMKAQFQIMQRMARQAEVVVMTCASSGNKGLVRALGPFPVLVLDEAAQCIEPAPFVPLSLGCQCLAAVGDERQLPATVVDRAALYRGLGCSLFERCVRDGVVAQNLGFVQLDEQRRMHPSIAAFPAAHFYGGGLRDATEVLERVQMPGFLWPSPMCHVCFVDCGADREDGGRSRSNSKEATVLMKVLEDCLGAGVCACDIAVVTGYSAQQALLKQHVAALGSLVDGLKIDTVDGFQGAERDLVLVSTVRANASGEVGFMRDPRRVNVLLTRARRGLIVFGDAKTLDGEAQTWSPWLRWVHSRGSLIDSQELMQLEAERAPQHLAGTRHEAA